MKKPNDTYTILIIHLLTLSLVTILKGQDFRGLDYRFAYLENSEVEIEVEINLYFNTTIEPGIDSIFITGDGNRYPTGVAEIIPLQRGIEIYRFKRMLLLDGPNQYTFIFDPQLYFDAENVPIQDTTDATVRLFGKFNNGLAATPPFDKYLARWDDFEFDYYVDEVGDLQLQISGSDMDEDTDVGYNWSCNLEDAYRHGLYELPAPTEDLLLDSQTGEFTWQNPPGPGRYLIGFDLLGFSTGTNWTNNRFTRLILIELTEEDFVTSVDEPLSDISLRIFPNPATSSCQIDWPTHINEGILFVRDIYGRVFFQQDINERTTNNLALLIDSWPTGLYSVSLERANQRIVKKLVLK